MTPIMCDHAHAAATFWLNVTTHSPNQCMCHLLVQSSSNNFQGNSSLALVSGVSALCATYGQALEYQMQQGMAEGMQQPLFLMPETAQHSYGPPLQGNACNVRLLTVG